MRHFLASRAVAALALRVRQAPRKARLVARAGCPQRGRAGTLGAAGGAIALPPITVAADQHCRAACSTEIASSGRLHGPWGRWETRRQRPLRERLRAQRPRRLARVWGATLGMTWRFEPVSRLRCHRPSPIVRASATRVPNALPPDCTNTPPAIGAPGSGAFPVALRAPSNAPDPIKQTAAIRSPDQGHAVPCRRWTPDLCGNRPPLTMQLALQFLGEAHERTSAFHGNLLVGKEKRGRHILAGMRIPARVDGGAAIGRSEKGAT